MQTPRTAPLLALAAVMAFPLPAWAADEDDPGEPEGPRASGRADGQRNFGLAVHFGPALGFGGGFRFGSANFGGEMTAGFQPILILGGDIDLVTSGQINASMYGMGGKGRFRGGAKWGYRYNSALGHGGGGGFHAAIDIDRVADFTLDFAVTVFPEADDRLHETGVLASNEELLLGATVQIGIGAGFAFHP